MALSREISVFDSRLLTGRRGDKKRCFAALGMPNAPAMFAGRLASYEYGSAYGEETGPK